VPAEDIEVVIGDAVSRAADLSASAPIRFTAGSEVTIRARGRTVSPGTYDLEISPITREIGAVTIRVQDNLHALA
jgi:hypothetical protein